MNTFYSIEKSSNIYHIVNIVGRVCVCDFSQKAYPSTHQVREASILIMKKQFPDQVSSQRQRNQQYQR